MTRKTIVVFFHARRFLPLRTANEAHLLCWGRYSRHNVAYVNVGFSAPWWLLRRLKIDAVIFDTIFLSLHWAPEYFRQRSALCAPVASLQCPKIAIVQDEFYNIDVVVEFLNRVGVTHVLTCSEEGDWSKLYSKLDLKRVQLRTVLTGYVDETCLRNRPMVPLSKRPIDLGYRAWNNPYWLGEHGRQKVRVAQVVGEAARRRGLRVDINNPAALDFLVGEEWYGFLSRCRAVLGVEGGASVLDGDGSVKQRVEAYLAEHPAASFEETREQCFPFRDHEIRLACLSPRHLEACVTRTCQLLVEGNYNGILKPLEHYIPIKSDYSNVEEVLDALQDDALVEGIVNRAYLDIVASGRWSYRAFVRDIEETIIDPAPSAAGLRPTAWFAYQLLRLRDLFIWRIAYWEASKFGAVWQRIVHFVGRTAAVVRWLWGRTRSAMMRVAG